MSEYIKTFLLGGGIISLSKYVSTILPPAYSGLIGAAPTSLITSFFLANDKVRDKFYKGAAASDCLLACVIMVIIAIRSYTQAIPVNYITAMGLVLWGIIGIFIVKFVYKE